jgi:hypothetical protein
VFATLESCLEPRFRRPSYHRFQGSSSLTGTGKRFVGLAGGLRQCSGGSDATLEFCRRHFACRSRGCGMAPGTHQPGAALFGIDQSIFRESGEADRICGEGVTATVPPNSSGAPGFTGTQVRGSAMPEQNPVPGLRNGDPGIRAGAWPGVTKFPGRAEIIRRAAV